MDRSDHTAPPDAPDFRQQSLALEHTVTQLRTEVETLQERYRLREEHFKRIRETNDVLVTQAKDKWTKMQLFAGIIGTVMTINFGYQLFKTTEILVDGKNIKVTYKNIRTLQTTLEDKIKTYDLKIKHENDTVKAVAELLTAMTALDNSRTAEKDGYRFKAISQAAEAVQILTTLHKSLEPQSPIRKTVRKLLSSFITKHLRVLFRVGPRALPTFVLMQTRAQRAIELNPDNHRAHHFLGMSLAWVNPTSEKALISYKSSVRLDSRENPDWVNMAEIYLIRGDYGNARWSALRYLNQIDPKVVDTRSVAARLYFALALLVDQDNASYLHALLKLSREEKHKATFAKLERSFDSKILQEWKKAYKPTDNYQAKATAKALQEIFKLFAPSK